MSAHPERLARTLADTAGLAFDAGRFDFAATRLAPVLRQRGLADLDSLVATLEGGDADLRRLVVEAMVVNETSFFRDRSLFAFIDEVVLGDLVGRSGTAGRLRIWSAACATGQEPYSLAMLLAERAERLKGRGVELLASDISSRAVATARAGLYHQFEVQRGLSTGRLLRHFRQIGLNWQIADSLRAAVQFEIVNLVRDFSRFGPQDMILARNMFIYLRPEVACDILDRFAAMLEPGAWLIVGAAETLQGLTSAFAPDRRQPGVFVRL